MTSRLFVIPVVLIVLCVAQAVGQDQLDAVRGAKLKQRDQHWDAAQKAQQSSDFASAITDGEITLSIERELFGDDSANLIRTIVFLARCEEASEHWDAAVARRTDALARAIKIHGLAHYLVIDGQLALKQLSILRKLTPEQRRSLSQAYDKNNLITQLAQEAKYAAAIKLASENVELRETILGPDHPDTALSLNNLAVLYTNQANYSAAEPLFQKVLQIREKSLGHDHPDTALSLNNLAELYGAQANYLAAEPLLQRAIKIKEKALGPDHPEVATSLNNLAELFTSQGNCDAALPLLQRALKIRQKSDGPDKLDTALSLHNLAGLYRRQGNYAAAEPLLKQAVQMKEKRLGSDHPDTALSLNNLAELYDAQGNVAAAEPLYHQALKIKEKTLGSDHPSTVVSRNNLAAFYWDRQQDDAARVLAAGSVASRIKQLERTACIQSEAQQFLMTNDARSTISFYLTFQSTDPASATETWSTLLNWKGLITSRQTRLRNELKSDPEYDAMQNVAQELSRHILNPPRPPNDPKLIATWNEKSFTLREAWTEKRTELEKEFERREKNLSAKSALFHDILQQSHVVPGEIQRLLANQKSPTALVDLLEYNSQIRGNNLYEPRIAAFVARGEGPIKRVELGSSKEIYELVTAWRQTFGQGDVGQQIARALNERLWKFLAAELDGISTVLISPDGALAEFPWAALPGSKPGSYLVDEIAIAVIPVPQMLPQLLQIVPRSEPPESLLLTGDIAYGSDTGVSQDAVAIQQTRRDGPREFTALPAAQAELASIQTRYHNALATGNVQLLRNADATEGAFRRLAPGHQWLHVITHGYFAPESINIPVPEMAGIGAECRVEDACLRVTRIIPGGAAAADGRLKPGDEIVAINDLNGDWATMQGKSLEDAASLIRGPVGTTIRIKVLSQDQPGEPVEYLLKRAAISIPREKSNAQTHPGLLAGLAFAGANSPPIADKDDGILTALEVSTLNLNSVDTVVLSACETSLGQVAGGEGLLGLQRAFQVAGARTCLSSLWNVHDAGTRVLMERFYDNLWQKKMGKLESLREAQLWILHNPKEFYARFSGVERLANAKNRGLEIDSRDEQLENTTTSPYYWAAFVLSGDWR